MREFLKKVPGLRRFVLWTRKVFAPRPRPYHFQWQEYDGAANSVDIQRTKLLNVLDYTKTSGEAYAATQHEAGYHKITVGG